MNLLLLLQASSHITNKIMHCPTSVPLSNIINMTVGLLHAPTIKALIKGYIRSKI